MEREYRRTSKEESQKVDEKQTNTMKWRTGRTV